ncbi:MAG: LysR family transcriptional regulator [Acidobacteriota bacterium]
MLDLHHLHTFCVLAGTCNFTRAANELGCAQSTVTTHIKTLESEFGAALFTRSRFSRGAALTDAGVRALEYAGRLLDLANEAKTKSAPKNPDVTGS